MLYNVLYVYSTTGCKIRFFFSETSLLFFAFPKINQYLFSVNIKQHILSTPELVDVKLDYSLLIVYVVDVLETIKTSELRTESLTFRSQIYLATAFLIRF